ncbi:hypothetical protein [Xanthomonas sp. A1809]|uniref:hypothetical protein n=1 Tax=Xanthomonas sp. A1809 TaxID=2821275 RepID=UPI001ADD0DEB|nr:hypothetical protein [Xanthomonas sp. A1809]MBO9855126.1 hypothetical protein [Xanthomonas sp. A1809]
MLLVVVAPLISRAIVHPAAGAASMSVAHAGHHLPMEPATPRTANVHHLHHDMGHGMGHGMDHAMQMPGAAVVAESDTPPSSSDASHAEHEMGVDCEYCLIAARMIGLLVALLLLLATWPAVLRALVGLVDIRRVPALGTLGARGPPAASIC